MRKLLLTAFFLFSSLGLHAQTVPVTGNLKTVLGENLGSNTFIRFRLRNYKPNRPLVEGVGIIGQTTKDVTPDSNGLISTTVYDNDFIDPTNTFYTLEFYLQGRFVFAASYEITGSTFDFNTANPISTVPTAAIPTLESRVFTHIQSSAATTWTITHSFGVREVTLDFYDNSFNRIFPDLVTLTDINTVTALFVVPQAGRAVVMRAENVMLSSATGDFLSKTPTTAQSITGGFDLTLDGNFLLSLTGQNIGSPTVRPDAFLETVTTGVLNQVRVVDGNKFAQNSTGLQAAIDEVEAANGGMIFLPCGTYSITSALTVTMPSNNLGFKMVGSGICTILQPSTGMTVLTIDMGLSNYQSLYLADFAFDLNSTDSTALALAPAGQTSVVDRLFIDNNSATATSTLITVDANSHRATLRNIRIRGSSATADAIEINANAVDLNALDITGCKAAVIIPAGATINALFLTNSRLDSNVNGFKIDGAVALSSTVAHNHFESNTGSAIDVTGFDAGSNRVFALTVRDNYFTGMDLAAQDGITLFRANGVVVAGNHFKGTGGVAEAVTFIASVTDVSIIGNTVDAVGLGMTGFSGVPLAISDVTITQFSVDLGISGDILAAATGQDLGSASLRWDAFLETVTTGVLNNIRVVDGNKFAQTAAGIQEAIDEASAAGGGEVWIPSGTIALATTGLTMKAGVTLRGAGANATFLTSTLTSGVVISGGTVVQLRIIGLRIDGLDTSGTAIGIDIPDSINFLVRDVFVEDMGGVGIQVDTSGGGNSNLGDFDNVQSDSNGSDGFFLTGPNSNAIAFTGMTSARSNEGWGFNIESNGNILDVHGDGNNGGSNTEMRIEGDGNIGRAWLEGNEAGNLTFTANSVGNKIETLSLMLSGGLTDDGTDNIVYYSRNGVAGFTRINASASGGNSSFISNAPQVAFIGNATRAGRILFTSNNTGVSTGDKLFGGCNDPGDDLCVFNDAGAEIWRLTDPGFLTLASGMVINLDGDDADTRIEGVGDAQLLYVDASADRVGIGDASPDSKFDVNGVSEGQRFKAAGTALVAGDIAIATTGAWGDTSDATVGSVTGNDQWFQWTITAGGANTGANPTIVITFTDGTWTNAPIVLCNRQDFNAPATVTVTVTTVTATVLTLTFDGTPTATNTYRFACHVGGI
jgi:hypothetical protein